MTNFIHTLAVDTSCTKDGFCTNLPRSVANSENLQNILQIAFGIMGALAVLIIVIAAMNMVFGSGDPQKVAKSRSAIVYALVGLIIALSAEVIVTLVLGKL